jgi:hypothetical protein
MLHGQHNVKRIFSFVVFILLDDSLEQGVLHLAVMLIDLKFLWFDSSLRPLTLFRKWGLFT